MPQTRFFWGSFLLLLLVVSCTINSDHCGIRRYLRCPTGYMMMMTMRLRPCHGSELLLAMLPAPLARCCFRRRRRFDGTTITGFSSLDGQERKGTTRDRSIVRHTFPSEPPFVRSQQLPRCGFGPFFTDFARTKTVLARRATFTQSS
uniref:Putative secreted peptide n=1 Tax=Anopheles braziliensis TaxID=58242 RepID=A0A2M3ZQB1_9DIPT